MRWWAGGFGVAAVAVLAACSTSGGGPAAGGPPDSRSTQPPATPPTGTSAPLSPAGSCTAGPTTVTVDPHGPAQRQLCVRPGATVSLVLEPRTDDKRWTAVQSSAPVFVLVSGWRVDAEGTAHASLRCAGTRGGSAKVTALAKAPDVAGAARVAFTLEVTVAPYGREG